MFKKGLLIVLLSFCATGHLLPADVNSLIDAETDSVCNTFSKTWAVFKTKTGQVNLTNDIKARAQNILSATMPSEAKDWTLDSAAGWCIGIGYKYQSNQVSSLQSTIDRLEAQKNGKYQSTDRGSYNAYQSLMDVAKNNASANYNNNWTKVATLEAIKKQIETILNNKSRPSIGGGDYNTYYSKAVNDFANYYVSQFINNQNLDKQVQEKIEAIDSYNQQIDAALTEKAAAKKQAPVDNRNLGESIPEVSAQKIAPAAPKPASVATPIKSNLFRRR